MNTKIEIKKEEENKQAVEKHMLTAKTLSKAAEVNENLDQTCKEIRKVMKNYSFYRK